MNLSTVLRTTQPISTICRGLNSWTSAICGRRRAICERTYPTHLVLPDGSSITIPYHIPRGIMVLPVDPQNLMLTKHTLEPQQLISKVKYTESKVKVNFNRNKYIKK